MFDSIRTAPGRWRGPSLPFRFFPLCVRGRARRALLAAVLAGLAIQDADAQNSRTLMITESALWVTPSTESPLVIRFDTREALPPRSMLLVRGLPPTVTLSEGRVFGQGIWVVPLSQMEQLRVRAPAETSRSEISLALVTLDGKTLTETRMMLLVGRPENRPDMPTAATPKGGLLPLPRPGELPPLPPLSPPDDPPPLALQDRENAIKLLERGHASIRGGNVAVAQKFYQRAAERGLAEAALALAGTYDAQELGRLKLDVEPNPALARQWYERARQLGSREAEAKLRQLR
jgi:hypothetical protein